MDDINAQNKEYIDTADALPRVGGNMALYKKLLGRFVEGNHIGELEAAIQSGDKENAARQTHTLKGVSANLSLVKVWTLSVELEQLLKSNADYSACLADLKQAYTTTTEKISEILE